MISEEMAVQWNVIMIPFMHDKSCRKTLTANFIFKSLDFPEFSTEGFCQTLVFFVMVVFYLLMTNT